MLGLLVSSVAVAQIPLGIQKNYESTFFTVSDPTKCMIGSHPETPMAFVLNLSDTATSSLTSRPLSTNWNELSISTGTDVLYLLGGQSSVTFTLNPASAPILGYPDFPGTSFGLCWTSLGPYLYIDKVRQSPSLFPRFGWLTLLQKPDPVCMTGDYGVTPGTPATSVNVDATSTSACDTTIGDINIDVCDDAGIPSLHGMRLNFYYDGTRTEWWAGTGQYETTTSVVLLCITIAFIIVWISWASDLSIFWTTMNENKVSPHLPVAASV